jgi:hypothetical protein
MLTIEPVNDLQDEELQKGKRREDAIRVVESLMHYVAFSSGRVSLRIAPHNLGLQLGANLVWYGAHGAKAIVEQKATCQKLAGLIVEVLQDLFNLPNTDTSKTAYWPCSFDGSELRVWCRVLKRENETIAELMHDSCYSESSFTP